MIALVAWILLCVISARKFKSWSLAILAASTVWAALLVVGTECLSQFSAINALTIPWFWSLCIVVSAGYLLKSRRRTLPPIPCAKGFLNWPSVAIAIAIISLGIIAVVAPPNNSDSMTYHMSRVMHWIQLGSVAPYRTAIGRQIALNPGAEYIVLHLQLLNRTDQMANLVQWFSMLGSLIGAAIIAKFLGCSSLGRYMAAVFCVSLPMGILESTSTQNDYVTSFWLIVSVVWGMMLLRVSRNEIPLMRRSRVLVWLACLLGLSLGLAILTKATAYLFALPFFSLAAFTLVRRLRRHAYKPLALIGLMAFLLNISFVERSIGFVDGNTGFIGDCLSAINRAIHKRAEISPPSRLAASRTAPFAPQLAESSACRIDSADAIREVELIDCAPHHYVNVRLSPKCILSNILRNTALEMSTPFGSINDKIYNAVITVHRLIGLSPDDWVDTYAHQRFCLPSGSRQFHEDFAANPIHVAIFALMLLLTLLRTAQESRVSSLYALAIVLGFMLFCTCLRWQPWHCRLLLPLLVLASPFVGWAAEMRLSSRTVSVISVVLLVAAIPWIIMNTTRPLWSPRTETTFLNQDLTIASSADRWVWRADSIFAHPRLDNYFRERPQWRKSYNEVSLFCLGHQISDVMLIESGDDWEYPFWVLLSENFSHPIKLRSVKKDLPDTLNLESGAAIPQAVIVVGPSRYKGDILPLGGLSYQRQLISGDVTLYVLPKLSQATELL